MKVKGTSPATNHGYQDVFTGRFIELIEYLVEVMGTLPSKSPLHPNIVKLNQIYKSLPFSHETPLNKNNHYIFSLLPILLIFSFHVPYIQLIFGGGYDSDFYFYSWK